MNCPNLTNVTAQLSHKEVMRLITRNYADLRHSHIFPPRQGSIPSSYVKPKNKDPTDKNRVITSYFHYPMRRLLKLASKALTFCLRNLNKKHRHFTLHRLSDTKQLIRKMKHRWHKQYGNNAHVEVVATDLKQMYTYLNHGEIRKATLWLLDQIQASRDKTTINGRDLRRRKTLIKVDLDSPNKASFTTNTAVDSKCVIFSLDDLYSIVDFDLNNTYATVGNQIFKQNEGCPMGGLLSSFYGNTTCAYHENQFLNKEPLARQIYGIRQMDDLTLFIAHARNDPHTEHDSIRIRHLIEKEVYQGGLEAELQEPDLDTPEKYIHKFAGHEIHTHKNLSDIYTTTLNENKASVRATGKQVKVRYPNMFTYTNQHSKTGNIIGSIHRIRTQNTYRKDFTEAIGDLILELQGINYTRNTIKKCIYRLAKQDAWRTMLDETITNLTGSKRKTSVGSHTRTSPNKQTHQ